MNLSENPLVPTSESVILVIGYGPAGSTAPSLKRTLRAGRRRKYNIRVVEERVPG